MTSLTSNSNWVISNHDGTNGLIVGGYPGELSNLLQGGVSVFINLCSKEEMKDYGCYSNLLPIKVKHYHFPIAPNQVSLDNQATELVLLICKILRKRALIYLHSFNGHGRCGVISALVVSHLFKKSARESIKLVGQYHANRLQESSYSTPQTTCQYSQVERLSYCRGSRLLRSKSTHRLRTRSRPKLISESTWSWSW